MNVYCTEEFKLEYEKLIKNNSYKYLGQEIISEYFNKKISECLSGTKLNGNSPNPFIKKRLNGSGGSRLYVLIVIEGENIYFTFVHPKTGSAGYENINDNKKTSLLNNVYISIKNNNLYKVTPSADNQTLIFTLV